MFDLASARGCRHRLLTRYFGEDLTPCGSSCDACAGFDPLTAAQPAQPEPRRGKRGRDLPLEAPPEAAPSSEEEAIWIRLKALRKALATERGVPAYVVFSDATLLRIAQQRPSSDAELLAISGIGPKKLELYGPALRDAVAGRSRD